MPRATIDDVRSATRILLYGVTGSGKSTGAIQLGRVLDLPVHLVDEEVGWAPAHEVGPWVNRSDDEQVELIGEIAVTPEWILDSVYSAMRPVVWPWVDVIIGFDYPRHTSLGRLLRRSIVRAADKRPICNGNVETFRGLFARDSIIAWHFRTWRRRRTCIREWEAAADGPPVLRLSRPHEWTDLVVALRD